MAAKIVVACGSGVATSEMVAAKIRRLLADEGVDAEVVAVDIVHAEAALAGADAFVPPGARARGVARLPHEEHLGLSEYPVGERAAREREAHVLIEPDGPRVVLEVSPRHWTNFDRVHLTPPIPAAAAAEGCAPS